jgi:hypothetical protein
MCTYLPIYFDARKFGGVNSTNVFRVIENGALSYPDKTGMPIPSDRFSPQSSGAETFLLPVSTVSATIQQVSQIKKSDGIVEYPYERYAVDIK